ncbi:MAG: hypothetical protein WD715_00370 [Dongiaceae bacterium]
MGSKVVDFPISDSLRPEQVAGAVAKRRWESLIGVGITEDGDFEAICSDMTAERALWIVEWARQWALGLDEDHEDDDNDDGAE